MDAGGAGKAFDMRAECVRDQFDNYTVVDGLKLNGKLTLGENIADLGGMKTAYRAMEAHKGAGADIAGYSPEQAFFLGYAQEWCTKRRDEYARMAVTVDPHAPPQYRVNGPLSNLQEFSDAFKCPAGSKMVRPPEQRCQVW